MDQSEGRDHLDFVALSQEYPCEPVLAGPENCPQFLRDKVPSEPGEHRQIVTEQQVIPSHKNANPVTDPQVQTGSASTLINSNPIADLCPHLHPSPD